MVLTSLVHSNCSWATSKIKQLSLSMVCQHRFRSMPTMFRDAGALCSGLTCALKMLFEGLWFCLVVAQVSVLQISREGVVWPTARSCSRRHGLLEGSQLRFYQQLQCNLPAGKLPAGTLCTQLFTVWNLLPECHCILASNRTGTCRDMFTRGYVESGSILYSLL